jgi:tellurite methyltransferase
MTAAERRKWDARYREGAYASRTHPSALLAEWITRLPCGRALDVACGAGRNALFLAEHAFAVDALDISTVALDRGRRAALARGLGVNWLRADLDDDPDSGLPPEHYDVIVWVRYVHRGLMPHLRRRLRPRAVLLVEQHLASTAEVAGPRSAHFRLEPGELERSAAGLRVLYHREGLVTDPDGRLVALAQLVAKAAD